MKKRYYHTSGHRFNVGDVIGGPGKKVFMSNKVPVHGTIQSIVKYNFKNYEEYRRWDDEFSKKVNYYESDMDWKEYHELREKELKNRKVVPHWTYEVKPYVKPRFNKYLTMSTCQMVILLKL